MKKASNQRQHQITSLRQDKRSMAELNRSLDGEVPLRGAASLGDG